MSELRTLANGVAMVRLLQRRSPLGITRLAAEMAISRSAAHRIAATLLDEGVLRQVPATREYALADGISLTSENGERQRCVAVAGPALTALRDTANETVHLGFLSGLRVTFHLGFEPDAELRVSSRVGRSAPLHTAALGKVLLAAFDDDEVTQMLAGRQFEALTPDSLTSAPALLAELDRVRARGYASSTSETEVGVYSLAVPVTGSTGRCIAAIAVSAPIPRMGKPADGEYPFGREPELLREARACAAHISARLASR